MKYLFLALILSGCSTPKDKAYDMGTMKCMIHGGLKAYYPEIVYCKDGSEFKLKQ